MDNVIPKGWCLFFFLIGIEGDFWMHRNRQKRSRAIGFILKKGFSIKLYRVTYKDNHRGYVWNFVRNYTFISRNYSVRTILTSCAGNWFADRNEWPNNNSSSFWIRRYVNGQKLLSNKFIICFASVLYLDILKTEKILQFSAKYSRNNSQVNSTYLPIFSRMLVHFSREVQSLNANRRGYSHRYIRIDVFEILSHRESLSCLANHSVFHRRFRQRSGCVRLTDLTGTDTDHYGN